MVNWGTGTQLGLHHGQLRGLELRGWRNCWMVLTPTSLTSEMSLSWPARYTSIYELNKIINSPSILRRSSLVLASLQELNSCSWIRICIVILYTATDNADSRFDVHFIWHSNDVYKTWYLNMCEMSSLNFCTRHLNLSSKLCAYRISSHIWLKEKCRIIKRCSCPAHQGKQELEKTLPTYFRWVNHFIQLPDVNLSG